MFVFPLPQRLTSPFSFPSNHLRIAYGSENGLVIVDLIQKSLVINVQTADLYGKYFSGSIYLLSISIVE